MMLNKNVKEEKGITLVEVMVSMVLSGMVFMILGQLFVTSFDGYFRMKANQRLHNEINRVTQFLQDEMGFAEEVCIHVHGEKLDATYKGFDLCHPSEDEEMLLENKPWHVKQIRLSETSMITNNANTANENKELRESIKTFEFTYDDNKLKDIYYQFNLLTNEVVKVMATKVGDSIYLTLVVEDGHTEHTVERTFSVLSIDSGDDVANAY